MKRKYFWNHSTLNARSSSLHDGSSFRRGSELLLEHRCALPHGVRQSQDAQAKEVDGQQQVDVLLGEYLHGNSHTLLPKKRKRYLRPLQ